MAAFQRTILLHGLPVHFFLYFISFFRIKEYAAEGYRQRSWYVPAFYLGFPRYFTS